MSKGKCVSDLYFKTLLKSATQDVAALSSGGSATVNLFAQGELENAHYDLLIVEASTSNPTNCVINIGNYSTTYNIFSASNNGYGKIILLPVRGEGYAATSSETSKILSTNTLAVVAKVTPASGFTYSGGTVTIKVYGIKF